MSSYLKEEEKKMSSLDEKKLIKHVKASCLTIPTRTYVKSRFVFLMMLQSRKSKLH